MPVKPANAEYVCSWYNRLLTQRATWEAIWQDLADYLTPNKPSIITRRSPGAKTTDRLFEGTGEKSLRRLSANMHGSLTSSSLKWFSLKMRDNTLGQSRNVRMWLEDDVNRMLNAFNQSNFGSEGQELYVDLGGFGTGSMFTEEVTPERSGVFGGLRFTALPIGSYVIDEDPFGQVDVLMRSMKKSARSLLMQFPDAPFPEDIKKAAEAQKDVFYEVIHAIYPREGGASTPRTDARELKYASCYVLRKEKLLLKESGFHEFPTPTPRWSKMTGEVWGRGPGHLALPDVKTLNRLVELSLKAAAKAVDPPLMVAHDGIMGGVIRLNPAGITYVRDTESSIKTLPIGTKWDVIKFEMSELQQAIREAFNVDNLTLKERPQMTAEEVRARIEQMQKDIGPTLGRIETEFLNPLISRVFNMMFRSGALLPPPQEVLNAMAQNAGDIDIVFTGQMAKNQRIGEVYAIRQAYELATVVATARAALPGVDDVFDADENLSAAALILGVPEKGVRDPKKVAAIREDRAAADAEAAQVAQDRQDAGTMKDMATAEEKMAGPGRRRITMPPPQDEAAMLSAGGMME